jgi:hypothetical protein
MERHLNTPAPLPYPRIEYRLDGFPRQSFSVLFCLRSNKLGFFPSVFLNKDRIIHIAGHHQALSLSIDNEVKSQEANSLKRLSSGPTYLV